MKTTERYLGLILEQSQVTAVEITHSQKGFTLTAAGSFISTLNFDDQERFGQVGAVQRERTFASELSSFFRKTGIGARLLSFGLNSKMVMITTIPFDAMLSENEIEQHTAWELNQYYIDPNPDAYLISTTVTDATPEIATTIMVSVRKSFVNFLTHVCGLLNGNLHIVDIDHFGAENALTFNYPSSKEKRTMLVGFDEESCDASILVNGQTKGIMTFGWSANNDMRQLAEQAKQLNAEAVFLHGRIVTQEMVKAMKQLLSMPIEIVDPFKKVTLPTSLKNYQEVFGRRFEYASAVGLALRSE